MSFMQNILSIWSKFDEIRVDLQNVYVVRVQDVYGVKTEDFLSNSGVIETFSSKKL